MKPQILGEPKIADLGVIGFTTSKQQKGAYFHVISGTGQIAGRVKEQGVDTLGEVILIDELLNFRVDVVVGSAFAFKGLSRDRTYTVIARYLANSNYNALLYDRISPATL